MSKSPSAESLMALGRYKEAVEGYDLSLLDAGYFSLVSTSGHKATHILYQKALCLQKLGQYEEEIKIHSEMKIYPLGLICIRPSLQTIC